jgi:serine/threonine protein kinase
MNRARGPESSIFFATLATENFMSEERWDVREIWASTGRKWEGVRMLSDQSGQGIVYVVRNAAGEAEREQAGNIVYQFRLQNFGHDKAPGASLGEVAQKVADALHRVANDPPNTLGVLKRYSLRAGSGVSQTTARFQREVETLELLAGDPAVLRPRGAKREEWSGTDWMVTEYHQQGSLDARRDGEWVHRSHFTGNVRASLEALCPIIEIVAKMHSGSPGKPMVHRDIKPGKHPRRRRWAPCAG